MQGHNSLTKRSKSNSGTNAGDFHSGKPLTTYMWQIEVKSVSVPINHIKAININIPLKTLWDILPRLRHL